MRIDELCGTQPEAARGLAGDSAGSLYVANFGLNEILIYSPNYVQLVSRTITQNIAEPEDVAFDPHGNLWVANFIGNSNGSSGYITEYTAGVQNTSATVNNVISGPLYLSFDGLGDLWVLNNGANITIYESTDAFAPPSNLVRTITTNVKVFKVSAGVSSTRRPTVAIAVYLADALPSTLAIFAMVFQLRVVTETP